jgi:phosphoribosylaminoimidazolecarboxamide formyltransferase/IMP cyclohydrolase
VKLLDTSTALVSVTDKTGLAELAAVFARAGVHILASSGTKAFLAGHGVEAEEISAYTGSPEILGGRVKTLHPKIHGGILANRDDPAHVRTLADSGTHAIDFVVVNLYPFEEKYRAGELSPDEMVEFIDIGGITLLRAAAKNHKHVTVVTHPSQYAEVADAVAKGGGTSAQLRARLAAEAFALTATYDAAISRYLRETTGAAALPSRAALGLEKVTDVRYGENPHQRGALYRTVGGSPLCDMEVLQGKELSFNNYLDIAGAFTLARDLGREGVAIIKHTNPCGAAWCGEPLASFRRALSCDPTSAFGGIVAVNGTVEEPLAGELTQMFLEVVLAREISEAARRVLAKKKNVRVVRMPDAYWDDPRPGALAVYVQDAVLWQDEDAGFPELREVRVVTRRAPTEAEREALDKAWIVAKHVKSNAIVIGDGEGTVGIGAGQMSRVDSSRIASRKAFDAGFSLVGKVAASDAFFPFPDGVTELAKTGITAVVQPGGSLRDEAVIDAADEASMAMLFTGRRHFRHI